MIKLKAQTSSSRRELLSRLNSWLEHYAIMHPLRAAKAERHLALIPNLIKSLLGIFLTPRFNMFRDHRFVLQGTRNLHYLSNIKSTDIAIIGSWAEYKVAQKSGFGFIWGFPVEAAVRLSMKYGFPCFLDYQLSAWSHAFNQQSPTLILTYEDTQPLGAFLSYLSRLYANDYVCKTICIQHGYFPQTLPKMPVDGSFTDYNLLWDSAQVGIVKCNSAQAYDIGPPVAVKCQSIDVSCVVFVGSGANDSGSRDYQDLLDLFFSIYNKLPSEIRNRVFYRPHPNEIDCRRLTKKLILLFGQLDLRTKVSLLSNARAIFVGSVSSLLYEAHILGHIVIAVDGISKYERISFEPDYLFQSYETSTISRLITSLFSAPYSKSLAIDPPKYTFASAIRSIAGIDV
jgi:hypothetical protein